MEGNNTPPSGAGPSVTNGQPAAPDNATPNPSTPAAPQAAPEAPQLFKVKVSGEEREVPLQELISRYQKEAAAEKRFEEAAKFRKQYETFQRALATGHGHVFLQQLPPEIRAQTIRNLLSQNDEHVSNVVREHIQEQLRYENMTPEQQEAYRLRQENEQFRRAQQQAELRQRQQQAEAQRQQAAEYYKRELPKHLQEAGLPVTAHSMSRMAKYVEYALQNKLNWNLADVANKVREEYEAEDAVRLSPERAADVFKKLPVQQMTGEQIAQLLGEEAANKLREYQVSKMRPTAPVQRERDDAGRFKAKEPPKRMGLNEFRDRLEAERDARSRNRS